MGNVPDVLSILIKTWIAIDICAIDAEKKQARDNDCVTRKLGYNMCKHGSDIMFYNRYAIYLYENQKEPVCAGCEIDRLNSKLKIVTEERDKLKALKLDKNDYAVWPRTKF